MSWVEVRERQWMDGGRIFDGRISCELFQQLWLQRGWTNTFCNLAKYIYNLDKFNFRFGKILLAILTNTSSNLEKYIRFFSFHNLIIYPDHLKALATRYLATWLIGYLGVPGYFLPEQPWRRRKVRMEVWQGQGQGYTEWEGERRGLDLIFGCLEAEIFGYLIIRYLGV